jgi:hypothetical protein
MRFSPPAALAVVLCLVFGALSVWPVQENDLFFHVRVGEEILRHGRFNPVDSWTFTSPGLPWHNHEWLATAIEYLWSLASPGRYAWFPLLRGLLTAAMLAGAASAALFAATAAGAGPAGGALAIAVVVPAAYLSQWFQMRPELFVFVLFSAWLAAWIRATNPRRIALGGLGAALLWVNLHSGTAAIGIALLGGILLFDPRLAGWRRPRRFLAAAATPLLWLCSPSGIQGPLKALGMTAGGAGVAASNPDVQPFSLALLAPSFGGAVAWVWLATVVAGWTALVTLRWRARESLPTPYRSRALAPLLGGLLTALSFYKFRAAPYSLLFLLPPLAAAIGRLSAAFPRAGLLAPATLALWAPIVFANQAHFYPRLGLGVDDNRFPLETVRYLEAHRPPRELMADTNFGCFLIDRLPSYPVFSATSGEDFEREFTPEKIQAMRSPDAWRRFLAKYRVQAVLDRLPEIRRTAAGFESMHDAWLPRQEWALVDFDNGSALYLRRGPGNAERIQRDEYRVLMRPYPADAGASPALGATEVAAFAAEIDRCLFDHPRNVYCRLGRAALLQRAGKRAESETWLTGALADGPEHPAVKRIQALLGGGA